MTVEAIRWSEKGVSYSFDMHARKARERVATPSARADSRAVYVKERSESAKLGPISATYAAQVTCPAGCAFRGAGCYAEHGPVSMATTKRLNRVADAAGLEPYQVALEEAAGIEALSATRDLRLHVVGDCATAGAARVLAKAADRYICRGRRQGYDVRIWTYTHAWREIPRSAWGRISVLASCETPAQVREARALGYATALVVERHAARAAYAVDGLDVLPCPEQTRRHVQCATCRLCTIDQHLLAGRGGRGVSIAFAAHGDRLTLARARRTLAEAAAR